MRPSIRNFFVTLISSILIFGLIAFFIIQIAASPGGSSSSSGSGEEAEYTFIDRSNPYPNSINVASDSFTLLLIGTDKKPSAFLPMEEFYNFNYLRSIGQEPEGEHALWVTAPDTVNADAIVLIRFDKENAELLISSIPSNTEIVVSGMSVTLGSIYDSIGPEELCNRVFALTSLPIDYYAVLDLENFGDVMSTVGEISYEIPFDMQYTDPTQDLKIDLKKGTKNLTPDEAEQLLRYSGNGETARAERIGDFISTVVYEKISGNKDGIQSLFDKLISKVSTNFTETDFVERSSLITAIDQMNIKVLKMPGKTETYDGVEFFAPDKTESYIQFKKYKPNYYPTESEQ